MNARNARSLEWWVAMGAAPSLLCLVLMVPSLMGVFDAFGPYTAGMPLYALIWLLMLTSGQPMIEVAEGPSMTRKGYVILWMSVNTLLWLFFALIYASNFKFH